MSARVVRLRCRQLQQQRVLYLRVLQPLTRRQGLTVSQPVLDQLAKLEPGLYQRLLRWRQA